MTSTLDQEWVDIQVVKQSIPPVKVGMLHRYSRFGLVHLTIALESGHRWVIGDTTSLNERYPARIQQKVKFKIDFICRRSFRLLLRQTVIG